MMGGRTLSYRRRRVAEPRPVEPNEIEDLVEMIGTVFGIDDHYSKEYMASQLKRPFALREALVICEEGRPVSHIRTAYSTVSVYGCEFKVASIGCVGTVEAYRGRGYAGAILEMFLRRMEKEKRTGTRSPELRKGMEAHARAPTSVAKPSRNGEEQRQVKVEQYEGKSVARAPGRSDVKRKLLADALEKKVGRAKLVYLRIYLKKPRARSTPPARTAPASK